MLKIVTFLIIIATTVCAQTSPISQIEDLLLGGMIENRTTKNRLGVICKKYEELKVGEITTKQCVQFAIIEFNGKNETQSLVQLATGASISVLKEKVININTDYHSEIYQDHAIYPEVSPYAYFYGLTASNVYGCKNVSWGWCLLLPFTAIIDTAATAGYHVGASTWDATIFTANLIDTIAGKMVIKRIKKNIMKHLVFMLNTEKRKKTKTISNQKFNNIKTII